MSTRRHTLLLLAALAVAGFRLAAGSGSVEETPREIRERVAPVSDRAGEPAPPQKEAMAFAKTLLGRPYRPGGCTAEGGFDCSGLVSYVYAHVGLDVGRSSRDQARTGKAVRPARAELGDILVFAQPKSGRIFHAGLVLHNDADSLVMLHANERHGVHTLRIDDSAYWSTRLAGVRRPQASRRLP